MNEKGRGKDRLSAENELDLLKARLDLPDPVIEYLRRNPPLGDFAYAGLVLPLNLLVFVMALVLALPWLLTRSSAYGVLLIHAGWLPQATILAKQDFVAPLILGFFAGLFLSAWLIEMAVRPLSGLYLRITARGLHEAVEPGRGGQHIAAVRRQLKDIDRNLPPAAYLKAFGLRRVRPIARGARILFLLALVSLALDVKSIASVTQDGFVVSPYFSFRKLTYDWQDAIRIETSCTFSVGAMPRGGAVAWNSLGYTVTLRDGRKLKLGAYDSLRMSRVDALEIVDAKLSAHGVPKRQGRIERGCLDAKRRDLGERDYERLQRLL